MRSQLKELRGPTFLLVGDVPRQVKKHAHWTAPNSQAHLQVRFAQTTLGESRHRAHRTIDTRMAYPTRDITRRKISGC